MIRIHSVGLTSNMKGKLGIPVKPEYSKEDLEKLGKEMREEEADMIY